MSESLMCDDCDMVICEELFETWKAKDARILALETEAKEARRQRDEAETKWHAHQKNVPCAGCAGGHDTFWKSVVESPQWKAWTQAADGWDWMECEACGHISQAHFQAFMAFSAKLDAIEGSK